jgi:Fur family zinc uptake transcriptional regulator
MLQHWCSKDPMVLEIHILRPIFGTFFAGVRCHYPALFFSRAETPRPMSETVFHAPGHDHDRCTADALAHAETLCASRAQRLTPLRRQVLEVLLESHKPLGAYEIIDRAAATGSRPAPITIYRALDFLRDNGLVHRIERMNAFVACIHNHSAGDLVVFLICERCGAIGEAPSATVAKTVRAAAQAAGFTPKSPVIEITGVCTHCHAEGAAGAARS